MKKLLGLILGVCLSFSASADRLTTPVEGALWAASPDDQNPSLLAIVGDSSVVSPSWYIALWNIPALPGLPPRAAPNTGWEAVNGYVTVRYIPTGKIYELAQSGANDLPCGREFDLFLAPKDGSNWQNPPSGIVPSRPLNQLSSVKLKFGYNLSYLNVTNRCTGSGINGVNYAASVVSVLLSNNAQQNNPQFLYYQFILHDSRPWYFYRNWCPGYDDVNSPAGAFCVDSPASYVPGGRIATPYGGRSYYEMEIAAELKSLIAAGHSKPTPNNRGLYDIMDRDISHWRVSGVYFGPLLMGGATVATQWDSFSLETTP